MKNISKIFALLILISVSSCKKELERLPVGTTDIDAFYKTSSDAETALLGAYNRVLGNEFTTNLMIFNEVSSDDQKGYQFGSNLDTRVEITRFNSDFGNGIWATGYNALANINLLIEKVPTIPDNSFIRVQRKQQIIGEAKFLRAYVYWHLVHQFGGVPLVLNFPKNANVQENAIPRSSLDETYAQILKDLTDAEAVLPSDYNQVGTSPADNLRDSKGRITKWAAKMLLARYYLDKKDFPNAATKSSEVINSQVFKLSNEPTRDNNYLRIFNGSQNTEESILEVQNIQNEIDQGGYVYLYYGIFPPAYGATKDLYDFYAKGDFRFGYNVFEANPGVFTIGKYTKFFGAPDPDNYIIFRYAEALMINAEAQNEISGPNTTSFNYINQIRARAKGVYFNVNYPGPALLDALPASKEAMRQIIRDERRKEFASEGMRWYDLLRYGADVATAAIRRSTGNNFNDPNKLILPIPQREVEVSKLTQNPGYN